MIEEGFFSKNNLINLTFDDAYITILWWKTEIKISPILLSHSLCGRAMPGKGLNLCKNSSSFPIHSNHLLPLPSAWCTHFASFLTSMIKDRHSNLRASLIILRN